MPKVNLLSSKAEEERKTREFRALVESKLIIHGYTKEQFIKKWGEKRSSGYEKLADPRKLKYLEMVRLASLLKFSPEEKGAIL